MGYSTDFIGSVQFNRPLTEQEKEYINSLSNTRRMKRDVKILMDTFNGKYGNPFATENTPEAIYGLHGEYYINDDKVGVIDNNCPPGQISYGKPYTGVGQPGLWCQWIITPDCNTLEWDGGEKFYHYIEWLQYLIKHFFSKWGVLLNGEITWSGEDTDDLGKIIVTDNIVKVLEGKIIYK